MLARAFITGLSGLAITVNERAFIREAQPWGLIIFKRNVKTFQQIIEFIQSFREIVGWPAPVLVDQEGGRVQRLGPPHWPEYPPGGRYGTLYHRGARGGSVCPRPQSPWGGFRRSSAGRRSGRGRRRGHGRRSLWNRAGQGRGR